MNRCLLLVVCLLASCQHRDNEVRTATPSPAVAPQTVPADRPATNAGAISGQVVETLDAAGYTYARLDRNGTQIWVAGPQSKLAVGTKLEGLDGELMTNFHSNSLNRTFDQIYFVGRFGTVPTAPAPAPTAAPANHPAPGDEVSGTVVETMDAAGYTYAQLDRDGTKVWVAGPATKLAVGTKLGRMTGTLMTAFHSNSLNRTFDQIYFIGTYAVDAAK